MTVCVIDFFEVINIYEKDRQFIFISFGNGKFLVKYLHEISSVIGSCKTILFREFLQLIFKVFPFRYINGQPDDGINFSTLIFDGIDPALEPLSAFGAV